MDQSIISSKQLQDSEARRVYTIDRLMALAKSPLVSVPDNLTFIEMYDMCNSVVCVLMAVQNNLDRADIRKECLQGEYFDGYCYVLVRLSAPDRW